jgi:putative transposase
VHHADAGSQYTSLAFTDALRDSGIAGSIGSVGDALDNALMESAIGLYKTELINRATPWTGPAEVKRETRGLGALAQHHLPALLAELSLAHRL